MKRLGRAAVRTVAGVAALGALALALLLFAPLPAPAVRALVVSSNSWLLTNYMDSGTGRPGYVRNVVRKLTETGARHGLARQVAARSGVATAADVERLTATLTDVKRLVLSQFSVPHAPSDWSVFVSGVGYCDQINGVAAMVLAHSFPISETFNVWDTESNAGHTIGRVWSEERGEWLYYDLFFPDGVVFRERGGGEIEVLSRTHLPGDPLAEPREVEAQRVYYAAVGDGWLMNRFYASAGRYVAGKALSAVRKQTLASVLPNRGFLNEAGQAAAALHQDSLREAAISNPPAPGLERRVVERYIRARLAHIGGDTATAHRLYRSVAAEQGAGPEAPAEVVIRAASVFADRLDAAGQP